MSTRLADLVERWCDGRAVSAPARPERTRLVRAFAPWPNAARPGATQAALESWEARHGYELPAGLRAWLLLSNGLQLDAPFLHPLGAIGPMVPFARMPEVVVQPESWFELGNPNVETVCIDLAYRLPGGDFPLFTSGDDLTGSKPRIIASGFDEWFLASIRSGGREYWFDPGADHQGDPWERHRTLAPRPPLDERLRRLAPRTRALLRERLDERTIAERLGVTTFEVEAIARFLQHIGTPVE